MDFSSECLDKISEFGVLWYYGNKEGRIVPRDVERLDLHMLFQFLQMHKDVVAHEHWCVLFRGFFVIMQNRLELIHRQFKTLHVDVKRRTKPTLSEFQLMLSDAVDVDIDILTLPLPPAIKQPKQAVRSKKVTLIKEAPSVYAGEEELDIASAEINAPLADDGFGGRLNADISMNDFFNLGGGQIADRQPILQFDQDDFDLPSISQPASQPTSLPASQPTSQPASQPAVESLPDLTIDRQADSLATIRRPSTIQDESSIQQFRGAFASDAQSNVQEMEISERLPSQEAIVQQRDAGSESSLNLSELSEAARLPARRGRGLIVDTITGYGMKFHENNQRYQERNMHIHLLPMPGLVSVQELFNRPTIPHSIPSICPAKYSTERRETDELVIKEFPDEELPRVELPDLDGIDSLPVSPARSETQYSPTEQASRNLLSSLVSQVSLQVDRQPGRADSTQYSDRVEMARGSMTAASRRYFSDFEPMMVQSDYTVGAGGLFGSSQPDLDSLASYKADDERAASSLGENVSQRSQAGQPSELSFSFIDTVLDQLEDQNGATTFSELTRNFKRADAAKMFADLLMMKMRGQIELIQEDPTAYSEIRALKI